MDQHTITSVVIKIFKVFSFDSPCISYVICSSKVLCVFTHTVRVSYLFVLRLLLTFNCISLLKSAKQSIFLTLTASAFVDLHLICFMTGPQCFSKKRL